MSKMNFAYNPPEAAKPEVRMPLLSIGYVVLCGVRRAPKLAAVMQPT